MNNAFKGTGVALITPFTRSAKIDYDSLGHIIDHIIEGGVDYIVALGTTSEAPTMDEKEKRQVAAFILEYTAGRVPLVLGMGGNNTKKLCDELKEMDCTGYDAILSVCPYYNKPSQEGLFQHFSMVAKASKLPIILYNIQGRTGVNMLPETVLRLVKSSDKFIGIKEASGNLDQTRRLLRICPQSFSVISGDDALTVDIIKQGGVGVISVLAHLYPSEVSAIVNDALEGKADTAGERLSAMDNITTLLFKEGNPVGIKAALSLYGMCQRNVRLPLVGASRSLISSLKKAIEAYDNSSR